MFRRLTRSFSARTLCLAGVSAVCLAVPVWSASISVDKIATEQSPRQLSMALAADEKCNAMSLEERNEMEGLLRQVEISYAETKSFEESQTESAKGTRDGRQVACDTATKEAVRGMLLSYRYAMLSTVPSMRGTDEQEAVVAKTEPGKASEPETPVEMATASKPVVDAEAAIGEQAAAEQPAVEVKIESEPVAEAVTPPQTDTDVAPAEKIETAEVSAPAEPKPVADVAQPAAEPVATEEMQIAAAEPAKIEQPVTPAAKPIEFEVKAPAKPVEVVSAKVEPALKVAAAATPEIKPAEKPVVEAETVAAQKLAEQVAEEAKAKAEKPVEIAKPKMDEAPPAMTKVKAASETQVAAAQTSQTVVQPAATTQVQAKPVVAAVPAKTPVVKPLQIAALVDDTKITEAQERATQKATRPVRVEKSRPRKIGKSDKKLQQKNAGKKPGKSLEGLATYGQMAENYYRELRCRSMSAGAVNAFYRKVVRTHRASVSVYGVPAVAATLRSAERRAGGRSCG